MRTSNFPWRSAQMCLINLLSVVLFLDKFGNTTGIVSLTWGLAVILGSFFTSLYVEDCWYATVIMSIETIRVYATEADQEFFFSTTGGLKIKRLIRVKNLPHLLAVIICLTCLTGGFEIVVLKKMHTQESFKFLIRVVALALLSVVQFPRIVGFMIGHRILQFFPLLLVVSYAILLRIYGTSVNFVAGITIGFIAGYLMVLCMLNDVSQYQFLPSYLQEVLHFIFVWKGLISLTFILLECVLLMLIFGLDGLGIILVAIVIGNIQIPLALVRMALAYKRIKSMHYVSLPPNMLQFIIAFYVAVIFQGAIYNLSCLLEISLSHFFRRLLAYKMNLTSRKGLESIDMYYKNTYNVAKQKGIRAERSMDIASYALDSLKSKYDKRQMAALEILHSMLEILSAPSTPEVSKMELASRITTSKGALKKLMVIMWLTDPQFKPMRVLATRIATHIGGHIHLHWNHGILDTLDMLLNEYGDIQKTTVVDISGTGEPQTISARIYKFLAYIFLLVPKESDPWHEGSISLLGMITLERMAGCPGNCSQMNKKYCLIQKIVYHMSYTADHNLMISALSLVSKLVSSEGEVGVELRQKISRIPFLICGLLKKLDTGYNEETAIQWKLTITIFAALSSDDEARAKLSGSEKMIIAKCLFAFNMPSLRMEACQVLCNLSWDNHNYCKLIWKQNADELFGNLVDIMKGGEYSAANKLEALLFHSRSDPEVRNVLRWISMSHFYNVLKFIKDTIEDNTQQIEANNIQEGKKMEALIGLAAELCYSCYVRHSDHMTLKNSFAVQGFFGLPFVQHLMILLKKSNSPVIEYPRLRKVVINLVISLLQSSSDSEYAATFRELRLLEELANAEDASFEVESYRVFSGTKGVVADMGPSLNELVATARGSLGAHPGPSEFHSLEGGSEGEIHADL